MREARSEWVQALRALTGVESDTIRWNVDVGRWEFVMAGADGVPRSQFWGWYRDSDGKPIRPDLTTGLYPYRDLDADAMREALANLERSFIGNPYDGAGTTRREVMRRHRFNRDVHQRQYRAAGQAFADLAAERGHRLRGAPLIHVPAVLGVGKDNATRQERAS